MMANLEVIGLNHVTPVFGCLKTFPFNVHLPKGISWEFFFSELIAALIEIAEIFHGYLVFFPNALYLLQENKINFFLYLGNLVQ